MAKVTRTPGPGAQQLQALLDGLGNVRGKTGWFESAKYPDGTPVAYVAAIQEFGAGKIPPRPFMRPTVAEQQAAWRESLDKGARSILSGDRTLLQVVELLTLKAAGDIAKTISEVYNPPLAEATIRARAGRNAKGMASTKPLVDTGIMINSVTGIAEEI